MSDSAIQVRNLSKRYRIGLREQVHDTLGGTIAALAWRPIYNLRRLRGLSVFSENGSDADSIIWALKDVSFDVNRGESIGIIGRNGAGKSTLLKILSRITSPTGGRAIVTGRVSSLLEVGTGFHPELTGRENVYLNGAVLGMTRKEIQRKFDAIVDFSGVETFIDTPVKRYSTGMRLRLAFAVAAHLEPEILIVDEVLAVGDLAFQKKCLGKMGEVTKEGRTVLCVSHNMPTITRLCQRAILLDEGRLVKDGPSHEVVHAYLDNGSGTPAEREWPDLQTAPGGEIVRLRAVRVRGEDGQTTDVVDIRRPVSIEMEYDVLKSGYLIMPNIHFSNEEGVYAFVAQDLDPGWRGRHRPVGRYVSTAWIPGNLLAEGMLFVDANMNTIDPFVFQFQERSAVAFNVIDSSDGDSARGDWAGPMNGVLRPMLKWTTQFTPSSQEGTAGVGWENDG